MGMRTGRAGPAAALLAGLAMVFLAAGCAVPPSTQAAAVKEVDARQVGRCALISTINGRSLTGGDPAVNATNALNDAKEQAAGLGANVVVVESVNGGTLTAPGTARVKAYRCNN